MVSSSRCLSPTREGGRGGNLLVDDGLVDEESKTSSFDVFSAVLSLKSVVLDSLGLCL